MLSTHMVVIECHRICVCVCVCDYAIAIYLLDSLMRTRSRNSFMQSVPHFAIIGSYCYIAIEQKYINRKRHTREWAREWERARQLNITFKHIVGNSLVKQTNEAQNAWWLFLLWENVKFNENDLGREREREMDFWMGTAAWQKWPVQYKNLLNQPAFHAIGRRKYEIFNFGFTRIPVALCCSPASLTVLLGNSPPTLNAKLSTWTHNSPWIFDMQLT